jgi:hypothetical protein
VWPNCFLARYKQSTWTFDPFEPGTLFATDRDRFAMSAAHAYPRPALRAVLSAMILAHVFAVFLGPWAMPPSSDLARACFRLFQPYMQLLFLDNGYRFFAPEPGPSHLIRYQIVQQDGSRLAGQFPDRKEQWPRLLYHRYFMLSEFLNTALDLAEARKDRQMLEACARSYARHLARKHNARQVTLFLRQHELPTIFQAQEGKQLTDPASYEVEKEVQFGPYRGDEL